MTRWKNDEIEAIRSNNPQIGHPLIVAVRHRGEYLRANCTFLTPNAGFKYWVHDGVVHDKDGAPVAGIEPWDDGGDPSVCGIRIEAMEDKHDESSDINSNPWEIALYFAEGGIYGQENLNGISVGIHLKDDHFLRPELEFWLGLTPMHYDLSIMPDLTQNNQTISFSGHVKVSLK